MPPDNLTLEDLLPHRSRMLLIEKILEGTPQKAVSTAVVNAYWPFFNGSDVSPLVLIELTAQTAGICAGLARIKERGLETDKKSWLVGIKRADLYVETLHLKDCITTHAENSFEYEGYRQIKGTAWIGEKLLGRIELQAIQAEETHVEQRSQ
ncbi:MAG: hypothetical protein LJE94_09840 [Deltaproteobacteria bacterium]|nr:hypothetical protein [Deltaproteobacteria bacterium]